MIIVDRLQLRAQIDAKMLNMNIDKKLFVEAHNKTTFLEALKSDTRIVIVNLQKFGSVRRMLTTEVLEKLAQLRIAFLIDEIHRSHGGDQHEEMVTIFDELQTPFDTDAAYNRIRTKKNVLIGFTATPDDNTLARFGEFSGYAEGEKLWVPFDAYTMQEAIEDGYILNPLANIVPVAAKLLFDLPANRLKGFTEKDFKDIAKQQIYENGERIDAIAAYVADLLVKDVYRQIRGAGKAMLAVSSIAAAIAYKDAVTRHFQALVQQKKYAKYADAPIYIVYSDSQDKQKASKINKMTEQKVLENFALRKNGLIIVVAKLQTGFDEKRLHTLFLDKEVTGISAIQTISRVNRTMKNKVDCKIVDFSYDNVNVQNIKDAFEHYSNVVVSDFDPFKDASILDLLYAELKKADVYVEFFARFVALCKDAATRDNPAGFLELEDRIEKFIEAHPKRTADAKAKAAQYFTILNRIEYVIALDKKYSEPAFLAFYRKFNTIYNTLHPVDTTRDPIEVYYDSRIGIVEVETGEPKARDPKELKLAEGREPFAAARQMSILDIIAARNQHEEEIGALIAVFKAKMDEFFAYVRTAPEGQRLIVKIKSRLPEDEIYADFAKIYRKYKAFYRKKVGDYFFEVTQDLVEKLCDEFEGEVLGETPGA